MNSNLQLHIDCYLGAHHRLIGIVDYSNTMASLVGIQYGNNERYKYRVGQGEFYLMYILNDQGLVIWKYYMILLSHIN